jgi:flagellar capping protein FliD
VQTAEEMAQTTFDSLLKTMGDVNVSVADLTTMMAGKLDRLSTDLAISLAQANAAATNAIAIANASAAASIAAAAAAAEAAAAAAYSNSGDKFASGGYMTGPALVGEHGPELFDPRTSQIYTAPATSNIFGGNEVAAEIRALRDEVSMMRYETRSTATNTAKIARLQDNWDVRGLTVRTDVDQPLDTVTA